MKHSETSGEYYNVRIFWSLSHVRIVGNLSTGYCICQHLSLFWGNWGITEHTKVSDLDQLFTSINTAWFWLNAFLGNQQNPACKGLRVQAPNPFPRFLEKAAKRDTFASRATDWAGIFLKYLLASALAVYLKCKISLDPKLLSAWMANLLNDTSSVDFSFCRQFHVDQAGLKLTM